MSSACKCKCAVRYGNDAGMNAGWTTPRVYDVACVRPGKYLDVRDAVAFQQLLVQKQQLAITYDGQTVS